jgi:hypothetical protein
MIKELEDVLILVHELSEADQHDAAARLRSIVIMAEERDTMTAEEQHGLYRLRYNEKARKFGWKTYEQLMAELGRDC